LLPCVVGVYGLRVRRLAHKFPERGDRRRKWFTAEKAARRVVEPELRALLMAVDAGQIVLPDANEAVRGKRKA
jgi:hypothetical protein